MSAAERLAKLFNLEPDQVSEIEEISREIHVNRDLGLDWRPWWPSVGEVWRYKDQPPESMMNDQRSFHLSAWYQLKEVFVEYLTNRQC